ncbi:hypothetical protein AAVH_19560, partial [Aphelenchoides avenae]
MKRTEGSSNGNDNENNAFTDGFLTNIATALKKPMRLGGRFLEGKWKWLDGSDFTYTNWDK